jgi:hypothetical protein
VHDSLSRVSRKGDRERFTQVDAVTPKKKRAWRKGGRGVTRLEQRGAVAFTLMGVAVVISC